MIKLLISCAIPMLILVPVLAYRRRVRVPVLGFRGIEFEERREPVAPRVAGFLLLGALVMLGAAGMLVLFDG